MREKLLMTAEQERTYIAICVNRIFNYEKYFLYVVMIIQVYGIISKIILSRKNEQEGAADSIYLALYFGMLLLSVGCIFLGYYLKKALPDSGYRIILLQRFYGNIFLVWAAGITTLDQWVFGNISVYLIASIAGAVLIYFKPVQAILIYGMLELLLVSVMCFNRSHFNYENLIYLTIATVVSVFLFLYRYHSEKAFYLQQQSLLEQNKYLNKVANQDDLTGLKNRRFLVHQMNKRYQSCLEEGRPITFMLMDIDFFKNYNDKFGHLQGDECLRRVVWRINKEIHGENEYLIRYGGDEFLYVGLGIDKETAKAKAARFNEIIRSLEVDVSNDSSKNITISIGVYSVVWKGAGKRITWTDCVAEADRALYMAKNNGKDQYVSLPE